MRTKITFGKISITCLLFLMIGFSNGYSQRSKIQGHVKDADTGEPLFGANVILIGTNLGAATDLDGNYFIINVPVGTYQVQASSVGYTKKSVVDVVVSADRVSEVDFELSESVIQGEEVIVVAQKNVLHKEVSGTQIVVTEDQIKNVAGVREMSTFLELQPGVSTTNGFISIRGGSADQTGTFINESRNVDRLYDFFWQRRAWQ